MFNRKSSKLNNCTDECGCAYVRRKSTHAGAGRKILILTMSNLSLQVIWFIYRMILTRLAGSEALGLQSLVMQVYSIMVSVCITGLNVAVVTSASRIMAGNSRFSGGIRTLFKNAVFLFMLLFLALAAPIFFFRKPIAESLIGDKNAALAIVIVLGCIFLTGIENILKSIHIGTDHVARTACSELIEQSLRTILVYLLLHNLAVKTDHGKVSLILFGMFCSEFFSVSFLLASFSRLFPRAKIKHEKCKEASIGSIGSILAPAAMTSFTGTIFASAAALLLPGRLVLSGYTRAEALSAIGVLNTVAIPLVTLPMAFIGAVSTVLLPSVSACCAAGKDERVRRITVKSLVMAVTTLIAVNIPALLILRSAADTLFGVRPTELCFILLTIKTGVIYLQIISTASLNGMMRQRKVLLFAVIGESLQLLLIYVLSAVSSLHIYGMLIAGCIGETVRLVFSLAYLFKILKKDGRDRSSEMEMLNLAGGGYPRLEAVRCSR